MGILRLLSWKHLEALASPKQRLLISQCYFWNLELEAIFIFARMCVKTSTDVILQSFRFEQCPWQCEGKQRYILPNTCLAPAVRADKAERCARNLNKNSKSPRISGETSAGASCSGGSGLAGQRPSRCPPTDCYHSEPGRTPGVWAQPGCWACATHRLLLPLVAQMI